MRIKRQDPYSLVVGMTGVKLGDQIVQIGCGHGGRLAAIAAKVGLSGRALAVVRGADAAARIGKAAAKAGVLVEVEVAAGPTLPGPDGAFDLAIVDDTAGEFSGLPDDDRAQTLRETARVVRPGGRAMFVGTVPKQGLAALLARGPAGPTFTASGEANRALEQAGFRGVRTLADREGLVFVEGIKPRQP
jgi:ubiquinone/menaquinone biosynthesis C-methylase UbiE